MNQNQMISRNSKFFEDVIFEDIEGGYIIFLYKNIYTFGLNWLHA